MLWIIILDFKKLKNHESSIRNLVETFFLQRLTKEKCELCASFVIYIMKLKCSTVDSGGAPPEFLGSEKGQSLSEFSYYYEHPWI